MTLWGKLGAFPTESPNVLVQSSPRLVVLQRLDQKLKVIRRPKRADGLPNGLNWTRSGGPPDPRISKHHAATQNLTGTICITLMGTTASEIRVTMLLGSDSAPVTTDGAKFRK